MFAHVLACHELSRHIHWNGPSGEWDSVLGSCNRGTLVRGGWGGRRHRMEFACVRSEVPGSRQIMLLPSQPCDP